MATATTGPVLNIDTLIQRQFLTVDGEKFDLRNANELSVFDFKRLERHVSRLQAIEALEEPTPEDEQEYATALDAIARHTLIAPDAVHAKLSTPHRTAIMQAFIALSMSSRTTTRAKTTVTETATTPTGAKPPRASRGSTAGRQKAG